MLARTIGKAAVLISFMMSASPAHAQSSSDLVDGLIRLGVGVAVKQLTQGDQAHSPQSRSQGNSHLPSASRYPASDVRAWQQKLNALGFDAGPEDGVFGGRTSRAIAAYQQSIGAPATGDLTPWQREALLAEQHMAQSGASVAAEDTAAATVSAIENAGDGRRSWDFFTADGVPVFGLQSANAPVFFRLARLGADPGLLDRVDGREDFALELAVDHLPWRSPIRDQYLRYDNWVGENEFDRARTREAFLASYRDELLSLAPQAPFDVYVNDDHRLRPYDIERGGFDLSQPRLDLSAIARPFIRDTFESEPDIDELFWSLESAEAETILEQLARSATGHASDRLVHLLSRIEIVSIDASGDAIFRLKGFDVYDQPFSTRLTSFSVESAREPASQPEGADISDLGRLTTPPAGVLPVDLTFYRGTALLDRDASVHIFALIMLTNRDNLDARTQCSLLRLVMTDDVLKRYVDTENYCRTADGWLGADEFERTDNRAAFWQQYGPAIDAFAPAAPFQIGQMFDALWREYDASKGGFELAASPNNALSDLRRPDAGPRLQLFQDFDWPERIVRMDEATARAFRSQMNTWQQPAKELMVLEISDIDFERGQIPLRLVSLDILDPTLSETVYSFDVAPVVETVELGATTLSFTEPVALDDVFEAALTLATLQSSATDRDEERLAQALLDRDRLAYGTGQTFEGVPPNHVSLPFFRRQDTRINDADMQRLHQWAQAFVDGLPTDAQLLSRLALVRDGDTVSIGIADGLRGNRLREVENAIIQQGWLEEQVLLSPYSDTASILYVLPNRHDLYRASFDRAWLDGLTGSTRQQLARFEIEEITAIEDDSGKPLIIVSLKPISLSLLIDDREAASATFEDVPDLSEAGFVAAADEADTGFTSGEPIAFSDELIDLLIAAHSGVHLSPASQYHLLARRWTLENETEQPFAGRFFVRGAPMPDTRQAMSILPELFAWAETRAPALPVHIATSATGELPDADSAVTWGVGCFSYRFSGINSFAHQVRVLSSRRDIRMDGTGSWTDEEEKSLIFARAASVAERLILEPRAGCGGPRVSVEPVDRLETRALLSATMPQPVAGQGIGPAEFVMDGLLTLTAVEHLDALPTVNDVLPDDYAHYIPAPQSSASGDMDIVALRFEPESVTFRDNNGVALEAEPGIEMAALSADLAAELGEIVPPSASGEAYGPDIVGIQLGMSFEEAEAIVRQHMDVGKVLQGRRAFDSHQQAGQTIPLTSGILFISTDGREMIALIDEPPAAENRVLAAWRRVYIEPGTVRFDDVAANLHQKMGDPSRLEPIREGVRNMWREPSGNDCTNLYQYGQPQALASRWTDEGNDPDLAAPNSQPMPDAIYPQALTEPFGPERERASACGPFLTAAFNFDASRMQAAGYGAGGMDIIDQTLTDIGPYIEAFEASRAMIADQSASSGSGAFDAPFGPDMVGLRLGMAIEEAEGIVLSRLGEAARKFESTGLAHYGSGAAYAAEGNREIIALLEDPAAPGRLVAAWRRIYAPAGTSSTAILGDIVAKYGQPVWSDDESSQYFFGESMGMACEAALGTYFSPDRRMTELWRPAEGGEGQAWAMPDGFDDPHAPRLLATLPEIESPATCPTVFGVALNLNYEGGFIDTALTDQDRMNAMRQSPQTGTAEADTGIKF